MRQSGLRLDEYPLASGAGCQPLQSPEKFAALVNDSPAAARAAQMIAWQWSAPRLARLNTQLKPFGYQLQAADKLFTITQAGKVVRAKLNWIGQLSVSSSGQDFRLPVMDSYNSAIYLLQPDGLHALEDWDILIFDGVFPVFVGNDLISAAYDYQTIERPINNPALINIERNGQVISTYSIRGATSSGGPARGLWAWEGHWVLELPGLVVEDGHSLNAAAGYSEMFAWRLLKDQPFYIFRQAGQLHLSFNNHILDSTYAEVIQKPQGVMNELVQMQAFSNGLTYYARRGDTWYYVVLEAE